MKRKVMCALRVEGSEVEQGGGKPEDERVAI